MEKMANGQRRKWSEDDDERLLTLRKTGATKPTTAKEIGRSQQAVHSRLWHLKRQQRLALLLEAQSNKAVQP
jgi:predicted NAD-dependent protein-ADP-ribosyltransferase YbiA (DUF1768 family)